MHPKMPGAALLGLLMPLVAFAAPAPHIETTTALVHAGMAMAAQNLPDARKHLHHVINCLVAADDKRFDAKAGNPCEGMGTDAGALHDEASTDARKLELKRALGIAERGAHSASLDTAHVYAEWLSEVLQRAGS
ncbi:MAG: hypothetical protein ABI843_16825 [Dokdonella sp.]